jgi:hypothetical protein
LLSILALAPASAWTQHADDAAGLLGVWRGSEGDLPAVALHLTDEGGTLTGAIVFYLIRREPGKEPTSKPGIPEPLLHPKIEGDTLTFEVSHRLAHPPRTLSEPPVRFQLRVIDRDKGEMTVAWDTRKTEMHRDQY